MLYNVAYKKIRSISDGNFQGCYASNKAEKFKFRRLSQGIESCAQAQATKLRKEEQEIFKVYKALEKEKEKHKKERRHKQYYSQLFSSSLEDLDTESIADIKSHHTLSPTRKYTEKLEPSHAGLFISQIKKISHNLDSAPSEQSVKHLSGISLDSSYSANINKERRNEKRRNTAWNLKQKELNEVIPFYMQHSYKHYHYDPRYDNLLNNQDNEPQEENHAVTEEPSWKKISNIARLKQRRDAVTPSQENAIKIIAKKNIISEKDKLSHCFSDLAVIGVKERSSKTKQNSSSTSKAIIADSKPSYECQSSVLTPLERQELGKCHRPRVPSIGDSELKAKILPENHQRVRSLKCSKKKLLLRKIIMKKLVQNKTLEVMLYRDVFRTQSKRYDGTFLRKLLTVFSRQ